MGAFAGRMLQRETLKAWNKWFAQIETFWALQQVANRMLHAGLGRGFDQWVSILEKKSSMTRRERAWMTMFKMRKLTRAWRLWLTNAQEQIARGRIRDTFRFSKAPEEDNYAQAVDWRQTLNKGRTKM